MGYKQVRVDEHVTPQLSEETLRRSKIRAMEAHYGHCFSICKYCGHYHHNRYVCDCGVNTGYLEDENGGTVRPLVSVYEVPVKEKVNG